MSKITKMA